MARTSLLHDVVNCWHGCLIVCVRHISYCLGGGQKRAAKQGAPRIASFTAFRNTTKSCVIMTHMKSSCGDRGSRSQSTTATTDALGTQRASYTSEGPSPHKLPQGSERTRGQNQRRKYPQNVFNSNGSKRPLCLVKDFLNLKRIHKQKETA